MNSEVDKMLTLEKRARRGREKPNRRGDERKVESGSKGVDVVLEVTHSILPQDEIRYIYTKEAVEGRDIKVKMETRSC